ncbi:MAG TPA: SAM-dependent methyltransferase [Bacilli bacterium]
MAANERLGNRELAQVIMDAIAASPQRAISFRDFMDLCLYHPKYGYYMTERKRIGRDGDFYTSANIGSIMGEIIAEKFVRMTGAWRHDAAIAEWGAGTGRMAYHILRHLQNTYPGIYERMRYTIVETSPNQISQQKELLANHRERVDWQTAEAWFANAPHSDVFVFANELIDAFPVHRVQGSVDGILELFVTWDERAGAFREVALPLDDKALQRHLAEYAVRLAPGQYAEVNLAAVEWIGRMGGAIESGALITIDYGDLMAELFAPHRMKGTLMCYRNHLAADNPYEYVGEQDITAHVNFTPLIAEGKKAGFQEWRWQTQKQFLLENGILHKLADHAESDPFHPAVRRNRAIRQLLLSEQMSELFKVLEFQKK